jgi:ELWxxDGT repeat protein
MKKNLSSGRPGLVTGIKFYVFVFSFLFLRLSTSVQAQVHLVKDINQNAEVNTTEFASLTDVAGTLYFTSKQKELWKTDDTEAGSIKLKEFMLIGAMKNVGGVLYFFASDETLNMSLWKSDGSASGTVKVKESISGTDLTVANGLLFFIGNGGGKGLEVWRSDGTTAGTYVLKDIMKGGGNSNPTSLVSFNNKLFFVANNGTNGYEVWESDGTTAGTHLFKDIIAGKTSSAPNYLTAAGNTLFFMARDAALGQEVWKTDGTPEGTMILKDIKLGSGSSFPSNFIRVNQNIFFRANDGRNNFQLWKSDGTAEGTIQVTTDGYGWINGALAVGDYLYYILGSTLFRTDGTTVGTQMICEIEDYYNRKEMVALNGSLYVMSTDYYVNDLWRIDGLSATIIKQAASFETGGGLQTSLTKSGNNLYFVGNGGDEQIISLWKSDGTTEGTVSFLDLSDFTTSSYPYWLTDVNGTLYFDASEGGITNLWKSDGTEAGTQKVSDIYASDLMNFNGTLVFKSYTQLYKSDGTSAGTVPISTSYIYPQNLTLVGNTIFFKGDIYPRGYELWKTDGTQAGTVEVKSIFPGSGSSNPESLTNVNGTLFFSANDGISGVELSKSDGTEGGTVRVRDINTGSAASLPQKLTSYNGEVYFVAFTPTYGYELWRSDGTESGTVQITDINTEDASLDIDNLKVMNGTLYFTAIDAAGWALWKTDGTSVGTVKVKDFLPGLERIQLISALNNDLYILVSEANYRNPTLWKSDGTEAGTILLNSLGVESSGNNVRAVVRNGVVYFTLYSKDNDAVWFKYQAWVTDGTSCGTFKIPFEGSIDQIALSGSTLFSVAYLETVGYELFKIDESEIVSPPCTSDASARSLTSGESFNVAENSISISYYPNPFQKSFSLNVKGANDAIYSLKTVHMNGTELEGIRNLKCNVDYTLGANWNSGLYLLKIQLEDKTITKKVIKIN